MKRTWTTYALALGLVAALAAGATAQDLTVDEIVKKTNHVSYYQGQDGKARVQMTINDGKGGTRDREFIILRRNRDDKDEEQAFYVFFLQPLDVRQMVFMVHKHIGKDDDRWLYQREVDVVKRIAASDKRTSFVGSHFFYEDVSGRALDEDTHELVEAETDDTFYVLKNTPKNPDTVEFDYFKMWIHRESFIPVKVSYYKGGEEYRRAEALEVKEIQGFKTVTRSRMTDLRTGGATELAYSKVEYDTGLPDEIFTERYLKNPPREHLR
ncbi:MAG: outer membrane lipoprotein-sorting protein [Candidatus Hydrogenedentes bacterium]|nr:outer membrane lipoprotein-sorting protein [Candidatus Hydrogenedentota bacterium]